jgi:hypothetical protein
MQRRPGQITLVCLALALCGFGPFGPCAGGRLAGEPSPAPADWAFTSDIEQIQLETNPAEPHSVNAWCVALGGRLYVPTSMIRGPKTPSERDWVRNVTHDPRVRVRVGDGLYERTASRVEDAAEYDAARAALEHKYGLDPSERDPEREVWIYRLDPRTD